MSWVVFLGQKVLVVVVVVMVLLLGVNEIEEGVMSLHLPIKNLPLKILHLPIGPL